MSEQPDEQQSRQPDEQTEKSDEPQDEQPGEQDYFLKRSTMLPIEGIVYCLEHTLVHDDTTNPYGMGEESWCKKEDHRTVYYRGHKGDVDERLDEEARSRNKPQHGDDRPATRRMIAAPDKSGLSDGERRLVVRLVRQMKGKASEAALALRQLFGEEDPGLEDLNGMLGQLDSIIDKLGNEADEPGGD